MIELIPLVWVLDRVLPNDLLRKSKIPPNQGIFVTLSPENGMWYNILLLELLLCSKHGKTRKLSTASFNSMSE